MQCQLSAAQGAKQRQDASAQVSRQCTPFTAAGQESGDSEQAKSAIDAAVSTRTRSRLFTHSGCLTKCLPQ